LRVFTSSQIKGNELRIKRFWIMGLLFVIAIGVWSLSYFGAHYNDSQFLNGAMANLFSTILGVAVGIPIALWLNRLQEDVQAINEVGKRQTEEENLRRIEKKRKDKVLTLLVSELQWNLDHILLSGRPIALGQPRAIITPTLRIELWSAFSATGELKHIDNPTILAELATAYAEIRSNLNLELAYINSIGRLGDPDVIRGFIAADETITIHTIHQAMKSIRLELNS
jgi:hypothetical protein